MQCLPGGYPADSAVAFGRMKQKARQLLVRSGHAERGHGHRMAKAARLLAGAAWSLPADDDNPFVLAMRQVAPRLALNDAFIERLIAAERDGDAQYQRWADGEPDAEVARLHRQSGAEETLHAERLVEVRRLLALQPPALGTMPL